MAQTKGIIFDMDGTITLTQHLHFQAFREVFKKYGIDFTKEEDMKYSGSGGKITFAKVLEERGIKADIDQCVEDKRKIYDALLEKENIELVPGVKEFCERIKAKGLKRIIATGNRKESTEFILKKAGLAEYFQDIVTIAEAGRGKPFPDVFLKAVERLNLKPEECVVLEDSPNGIEAAKVAGIRSIGLATGESPEKLLSVGASAVVKDYFEITDALWQ